MGFAKSILAVAAMATAVAPVASFAGGVRPGDSLVSASAAAGNPSPIMPAAVAAQRTGAKLDYANAAMGGKWIAILLATGVTVWIFVEAFSEDEPDVVSP